MTISLPVLSRLIAGAALVAGLVLSASARAPAPLSTAASGTSGLGFIANHGQWDPEVLFMAPIRSGRAWVTETGIVYDFSRRQADDSDQPSARPGPRRTREPEVGPPKAERVQGHVVRLAFAAAAAPVHLPLVQPKGKLTTRLNYLIGKDPSKHARNVPAYAAVNLDGLWPGVSLRLSQGAGGLGLSFTAVDATALARARLAVEGASVLAGRGEGAVVATSIGQRSLGSVAVSLGAVRHSGRLSAGRVVLAPGRPAVKAPTAAANEAGGGLVYSTFLGSCGTEYGYAGALDASGAAYVAGHTSSSDFPTTPGAYDTTHNGGYDVFVTKLSADGSALVYSTFLGGDFGDGGYALAVDASGAAYVAGITSSSDFPTTPGAYDTTHDGGTDVFVTKLSADGSALLYSTFLGGGGSDYADGLAVDASGVAYVTGSTFSFDSFVFPTTPGAYDTTYNGGNDVFVTKLSADGSALVYSTFLGGNGSSGDDDFAYGLAVDASGAAYVTGATRSSDFPTTPGAFDTTSNGGAAFVTKFSADGSALVYSTYLGGSYDVGTELAVDASGAAYVTGQTQSPDFPTTPGAYDTSFSMAEAFATKFSADGSALVYSTFLGGGDFDSGDSLAVDASGAAYVTGETQSPDFPTTPGAYDTTYNGTVGIDSDVFVTKLSADGSALAYSTFLGSSSNDWGKALAIDASGAASVAGMTSSSGFPTTPGAYDTTHNGGYDAFVTKLDIGGMASGIVLSATATPTTVPRGGSFTVNYTVSNNTDAPITEDLFFTALRNGHIVTRDLVVPDITVAAHDTFSGDFTQLVSNHAVPGVYICIVRFGSFHPDRRERRVVFRITVTQ